MCVRPAGGRVRVPALLAPAGHHALLLVSDFGCESSCDALVIITGATHLSLGYSPLRAMLCCVYLVEPCLSGSASFAHRFTFAGHPVCFFLNDTATTKFYTLSLHDALPI